jgi:hypothetical protein
MRSSRLRALVLVTLAAACARDTARDVPQYAVADFYQNDEYFGGSFSHDNERLLVSSNRSGVYNAWAIPVAGGEPQPLTQSTTDAVFAVSFFPADDRLLYTSDRGGNELAHLYVREADGTARDLTPGENLNAQFAGWAGDDASFFVATNERDQRFFDLYEYRTDGYARTLFYRNTEGYLPGPISRDKRYVALVPPPWPRCPCRGSRRGWCGPWESPGTTATSGSTTPTAAPRTTSGRDGWGRPRPG